MMKQHGKKIYYACKNLLETTENLLLDSAKAI